MPDKVSVTTRPALRHGFVHSRAWDLAAGLPCILFNATAAAGFAVLIARQAHQRLDFAHDVQILSKAGSFIFFSLQSVLVSIRRLPLGKLGGFVPRLVALLAAYSSFALVLLPGAAPSTVLATASSTLLLAGTTGSIVTLAFLGRSFAILPQARSLVTSGPYRYSRHPLYLFEQLSLLGVSLQFAQPWALMIAAAGFVMQFPRMRFEEQILLETFPEYDSYRKRTPLIVPGL